MKIVQYSQEVVGKEPTGASCNRFQDSILPIRSLASDFADNVKKIFFPEY